MGDGELFKPFDALSGECDGAFAWTAATNHSTTRYHGYLAHLRIHNSLVISAGNHGNAFAWRFAAGWLRSKVVIEYSLRNGDLLFSVQVVPRASRSEIVGEHNGSLRIRLAAPPVDGAANDELRRFLSKSFNVPKSAVQLISGRGSRTKQIRIIDVDAEVVKTFTKAANR
jgi:uncharacterized protein (TIGR00251 family)